MKTLDEASTFLPSSNWWIKADGVDVISSLEESLKLEWNGDVDLGDGKLQKLYQEYRDRLEVIGNLDSEIGAVEGTFTGVFTLQKIKWEIDSDLEFIHNCKPCSTGYNV